MQTPPPTAIDPVAGDSTHAPATRVAARTSPGAGRPRRIGGRFWVITAAGIAIAVTLASWGWLATRFNPLEQARASYGRRQYSLALKSIRHHLGRFPNDQAAALLAARCLTRMSRPAEAEEHYRRAGTLGPDDLQERAMGLVRLNDPEGAARVYETLLALRPDDALALKRLAAVRMGRKEWKAVLVLAERLRAVPSEEIAGLTLAAIAHHESKHRALAVEAGRRVILRDPDLKSMPLPRALFWNNLALDLLALGQADEARALLERAVAQNDDAGLMELLGLACSHLGRTDEAERWWREAERRDPGNADLCLDLGRLALSRRRWEEAAAYFRHAAERSPDAPEPLYNLSQAYRMLGRTADAEQSRRLADECRRAHPKPPTGMGADAEVDGMEETRGEAPLPGPSATRGRSR